MSSFKRRAPSAVPSAPAGTRLAPGTPSVHLLSTGIPSLDDVLGVGQPLGSVLTILSPDPHSSWGELIQRYYIAQGLASGQDICVVGERTASQDLVNGCMWTREEGDFKVDPEREVEDDEGVVDDGTKVKIAWRYENMKKFQTSVSSAPSREYRLEADKFSHPFDLTLALPSGRFDSAIKGKQLTFEDLTFDPVSARECLGDVLRRIKILASQNIYQLGFSGNLSPRKALRICIPDLGSPSWGDVSGKDILRFLYLLRNTVKSTTVAALITLPPYLSTSSSQFLAGAHEDNWIQKLGFISDGCVTLSSFGTDPALSTMFPSYHGLVRVHSTPAIHTLVPPSHKHSLLRGLSSPANHSSGGGENNLGFRCTRKRFIIETLHLDVEGGVGERRTEPPPSAHDDHSHATKTILDVVGRHAGSPTVQLELPPSSTSPHTPDTSTLTPSFKAKKKKVVFHSDKPELYDF